MRCSISTKNTRGGGPLLWLLSSVKSASTPTFLPRLMAEATPGTGGSMNNAAYTYLAHDHLGTTRKGYNQAKTEIHSNEHLPFGQRFFTTGTVPYHEWTGKLWDAESQMYYFPYRYYSSIMNRWTATDPLGLVDGPNVYGYVGGNPIMRIDPEGGSWTGVFFVGMLANTVRGIIEALYKIKLKAQIQNENIKLSKKIDEVEARLRESRYCLEERHMLFFHNLKLSLIVESAYQGGAQEIIELLFSFIF